MPVKSVLSILCVAAVMVFLEWKYSVSSVFNLDLESKSSITIEVFGSDLAYAKILAGEKFFLDSAQEAFCTVAAVRLADEAPNTPPENPLIIQEPASFGGNWRAAPERSRIVASSDVLKLCSEALSASLAEEVSNALARRGAFFIRDWRDKTLEVYSYEDRLAVFIHLEHHAPPPWQKQRSRYSILNRP
jgi:hypothetical protein